MLDTNINIYGLMLILSFITNIVIVFLLSKKYSFSRIEIICLLVYEGVGIVFGAKILTFLQSYNELNGKFDFISLGLSSYGGVIGALIMLAFFCWQFRKPFAEMLYIFMTPIPLMYALGKLGCFMAGCCHGFEYNGLGNVVYNYSVVAEPHIHYFPVQILETIVFSAIFIYMIRKHVDKQFDLRVLGISFILCGVGKFTLDFFRISHVNQILSLNQIISILFIIIGIIMTLDKFNHKKTN